MPEAMEVPATYGARQAGEQDCGWCLRLTNMEAALSPDQEPG